MIAIETTIDVVQKFWIFGIIYIDRAEFLLMPKFGQQTVEWNILLVITGKNAIFHNLALFFIGF